MTDNRTHAFPSRKASFAVGIGAGGPDQLSVVIPPGPLTVAGGPVIPKAHGPPVGAGRDVMAEDHEDDRLMGRFRQWQLGIFLLVIVIATGSIAATVLQHLDVPFAGVIGGVGGGVFAFLAISYWFYGR